MLDQQSGLLLSQPTTILVMGRDRNGLSDSLQIVRVDPGRHLVSTLAIPRDLKVDIPGRGADKINVAYSLGGAALAVETVRQLTGVPINHVVLIDFRGFRQLVDAVGGIDIYNRERVSSEFDGHTYHFKRGRCTSTASARSPTPGAQELGQRVATPTSPAASASSR